ncbi:MAG: GNAT family N-acetyltransferase [Flavobacterium sp.]|nr:MAG: GNAT family N-acetyltransferase [Flavobacterium sp.]
MNYTIVNVEDANAWKGYVQRAHLSDFYHSWHYHSTIKDGDPFLFIYESGDIFIAIPLIKRKINDSEYYDLTSAYGYLGPITNLNVEKFDEDFLTAFKEAFLSFMRNEKIICAFSRLHPLMEHQVSILENIGGIYPNGSTVNIDLQRPIEEQIKNYRKTFRNSINSLIESSPNVKAVVTDLELELFVSIYTENMNRIGATDYYHFDLQYFRDLIGTNEFFAMPLIMYLNDIAIAAGFFVYTHDIIQVHLLATRTAYLHLSPTKLLVHEASKIGRDHGMKHLHLGGGLGGSDDSLFFWKSGFSNQYLPFMTWRYIDNQQVYDQLTANVCSKEGVVNDFFPAYRMPEK